MTQSVVWEGYDQTLRTARERTGLDESVTVQVESFGDVEAVVARLHFSFLGGSMGREHGARIVQGLETAIALRVPFVAVTASGGARTHEGFDALIQMRHTVSALARARAAGIPTISWFRHPTTGGVHASYGAGADLIVAERGATVGFAGPRVVEALAGTELDGSSHTAEAYFAAGLIDALADDEADAHRIVGEWVRLVHPQTSGSSASRPEPESDVELDGWAAVERARAERPTARDIIRSIADSFTEVRGDRAGADDGCMVAALARVGGSRVMVVGTDRDRDGALGRRGAPAASGFRKAQRAVQLATRWRIPIVTLVDTRGADPVPASDRGGLAVAISELMTALASTSVPTMAVVSGEGGSGGAMALAATDRLVMQDDSVFEVIAPEGAASIVYKDPSRASEIAEKMGLGAASLRRRGYSDATLPGPTTHGVAASLASVRATVAHFLTTSSPSKDTHDHVD